MSDIKKAATQKYLFIGGNSHGEVKEVAEDLKFIRIAITPNDSFQKFLVSVNARYEPMEIDDYEKRLFFYKRERLPDRQVYVFVHCAMDLDDAAKAAEKLLRSELSR
jgi:hypothetical protein